MLTTFISLALAAYAAKTVVELCDYTGIHKMFVSSAKQATQSEGRDTDRQRSLLRRR